MNNLPTPIIMETLKSNLDKSFDLLSSLIESKEIDIKNLEAYLYDIEALLDLGISIKSNLEYK